jgi:predicted small metal-binding protein
VLKKIDHRRPNLHDSEITTFFNVSHPNAMAPCFIFCTLIALLDFEKGGSFMKLFKCKDIGYPCNWSYRSNNPDDIVEKAGEHGQRQHGLKDYTKDLRNKVRSVIQEEKKS